MQPENPTISPNNPCPFLRMLVSEGMLQGDCEPIENIIKVITEVADASDIDGPLPISNKSIFLIALVANGIGPVNILTNLIKGVRLNQLRDGPLDKKGVGSRILDSQAEVQEAQINRLNEFASTKIDQNGNEELGLNSVEITAMMDENFDRAKGNRRKIDRKLMEGEWPILLKVLGKKGLNGPYIALTDIDHFFNRCQFPDRLAKKLNLDNR